MPIEVVVCSRCLNDICTTDVDFEYEVRTNNNNKFLYVGYNRMY